MIIPIVTACILLISCIPSTWSDCIWHDKCGPDPDYPPSDSQHYLMCQYDGPARQVTQEMAFIVQDICPHLTTQPSLCCSLNQLQDMKKNFELPAALIAQTCPTCYYNFRKNFCDLVCHPHQSEFVQVDGLVHGLGDGEYAGENKTMVKEVTYHVSEEFNTGTYESCKNVQLPSNSDTLMGLLCGPHGIKDCTAKRWFDYMGSISPFQINFDYGSGHTPDNYTYHNPPVTPCQMSPQPGVAACGCADCPQSCTITQDLPGVESTTSTTDTSTAYDDDDYGDYGDYGDIAATQQLPTTTTLTPTTRKPDAVGVIPVKYYYYYFIKTY